jgi:multisubunit Na+/H+ antiporter MnhE subunit
VRFPIQLSLQWTALVLLWFLFVFQFSVSELLVGAAASALAVLAVQVTLRAVPLCFEPKLRWVAQALRLPGMIAEDLWILLKEMVRRILHRRSRSMLAVLPFAGSADNCRGSAQRVLALVFVSTSPNSVVLDIDSTTGDMLIHRLQPQTFPALLSRLEK